MNISREKAALKKRCCLGGSISEDASTAYKWTGAFEASLTGPGAA